jgi:hypothetical protein
MREVKKESRKQNTKRKGGTKTEKTEKGKKKRGIK